ncbi:MAG TPA: serine hydrolase domain-containing protein [Phycisphaerae bacterium]|jgi:CubicO group peptidase (beta-lactamase class C family)|nr:serine hydrolase domain-containing protein [Phycisphaerae bacterium]
MQKMPMAMRSGMAAVLLTLLAAAAQAADPDFSPVHAQMQQFVEQGQNTGIVTLVATKDKILYEDAVGTSDGTRKAQKDDLFWIASMSKPITALAAGILVDDGRLKWDDPVEKYIPEFKDMKVNGESLVRPIQLRDLLTHTSGLPEYSRTDPHWTLEQFARQIASQGPRTQPGARWSYSTAGIDAVGRVVEVASGMKFDEFLSQRLFEPVGMKDTSFWLSEENAKRYSHTYVMNNQTQKLQEQKISYFYGSDPTDKQRPPLGGAGLISTAQDICRLYQMTMNNGKAGDKQIIKAETLKEMLTPQTGNLRPGMPWGYGFAIMSDPKFLAGNAMLSPNSYGHGGAFGTNSWVDPKRGAIFVLMLERDRLQPSPDNSPMHIAFQDAAVKAIDAAAK